MVPTSSTRNLFLFGYAILCACSAMVLICLGGLVTSKGVGMAVPDWPTSFGYHMFWLPLDKWWKVGGIHDEHLHRLVASTVGALVVILAVLVQWLDDRKEIRRLGWVIAGLVVLQGLLGGLRVVLDQKAFMSSTLGVWFGIGHATLGQLFFASVSLMAFVQSPAWRRWLEQPRVAEVRSVGKLLPWIVGLFILQLVIAATMRQQHAGLAIPDFPLAYGKLWPDTDPASVLLYNQRRIDPMNERDIEAFHIHLQMAHRIMAVLLVSLVGWISWRLVRLGGLMARFGMTWCVLLAAQFFLGAATVWTNKAVDIATAHVAVGAISLMTSILLTAATRERVELRISQVGPCPKAGDFLKPDPASVATPGGAR